MKMRRCPLCAGSDSAPTAVLSVELEPAAGANATQLQVAF
jgi:hypothetical protein